MGVGHQKAVREKASGGTLTSCLESGVPTQTEAKRTGEILPDKERRPPGCGQSSLERKQALFVTTPSSDGGDLKTVPLEEVRKTRAGRRHTNKSEKKKRGLAQGEGCRLEIVSGTVLSLRSPKGFPKANIKYSDPYLRKGVLCYALVWELGGQNKMVW